MDKNELISFINDVKDGRAKYMPNFDAYAINVGGCKGVGLLINEGIEIYENFNSVEIKNIQIDIGGIKNNFVFLYTKQDLLSYKYAYLCFDFLDVDNRAVLTENPSEWFEEWISLLGNKKSKKMIFDYIGEMKVLLELQKRNKAPIWKSIEKGTFDIYADGVEYEVKTSTVKGENIVTIHNKFQLGSSLIKSDIKLVYLSVEKNDAGESIEDLYVQLCDIGFDNKILDQYLSNSGYYVGKKERYVKYLIKEIRIYDVDDKFPAIKDSSFVDGKFPNGIVNLQYSISLDGLTYSIDF